MHCSKIVHHAELNWEWLLYCNLIHEFKVCGWWMDGWMDVVHVLGLTAHHLSLHVFPKRNCWIFIIFYQNVIKYSACEMTSFFDWHHEFLSTFSTPPLQIWHDQSDVFHVDWKLRILFLFKNVALDATHASVKLQINFHISVMMKHGFAWTGPDWLRWHAPLQRCKKKRWS